MSKARWFWKTVYERFDPERPAEEHAWRVTRPYSPREAIGRGLERPMGWPQHYMVFGTTGTGISTELHAAAEERSQVSMVVFLDLVDHFSRIVGDEAALQHVQAWEVLFLAGLAIHRSAQELFGVEWAARYLDDFQEAVRALRPAHPGNRGPAIDVARLASATAAAVGGPIGGLAGAGLRTLAEPDKSARWDFEIGRRDQPSLPDQDPRVRRLLDAVNQLIGAIQSEQQHLVVVIDGLERIKSEETTRRLFVDSTVLGELSCTIVVDAPLLFKHASLVTRARHFKPLVLANVPVIDHADPRCPGPGIEIMKEVYRRRVSDLEPGVALGIPRPLLGRLAYYSGGCMRDFVRLVRLVSEACWDRDLSLADEAAAEACIDERRRAQELGITQEDLEILARVIEHPLHLLPASPRTQALLEQNHLLPYPNESEWYFPHPLLTLHLLPLEPQPASTGSGGPSRSPAAE